MPSKNLDLFISLIGRDRGASGLFDSVLGSANRLKNDLGNQGSGLLGSMFAAEVASAALFKTLDLGFQAASASVLGLRDAFTDAIETETSLVSQANTFAVITGQGLEEGEKFIERFNAKLGKVSASLKGTQQDYLAVSAGIMDDVLPAYEALDGSFDAKGAEDNLLSLSKSFGLLGATSGVAASDMTKGLAKALKGGTMGELRDLLLYEQNPALLSVIEEGLAEKGAESLKDLDMKARLDLITAAGERFASPEYIDEISQTVGATFESFTARLLDPQAGIFSIQRDLFKDVDGKQSVFTQLGDTAELLLSDTGIFGSDGPIANIMQALGIEMYDPMQRLYGFIQRGNIFLEGAIEVANDIAERIEGGLDIGRAARGVLDRMTGQDLGRSLGTFLTDTLRTGLQRIGELISAVPWARIGNEGGQFLGASIVRLIREFPYGTFLAYSTKALISTADFIVSTGVGILRGLAIELWNWVKDSFRGALRGAGNFLARDIRDLLRPDPGAVPTNTIAAQRRNSDRAIAIPDNVQNLAGNSGRSRRPVRARAMGQAPDGMEIMSAVAMERAAVPAADIVIANSTEAIVPKDSALIRPNAGGRSGSGARQITNNFNPTIVLPQGSTRQMAEQVLEILNGLVAEGLESQLV